MCNTSLMFFIKILSTFVFELVEKKNGIFIDRCQFGEFEKKLMPTMKYENTFMEPEQVECRIASFFFIIY